MIHHCSRGMTLTLYERDSVFSQDALGSVASLVLLGQAHSVGFDEMSAWMVSEAEMVEDGWF